MRGTLTTGIPANTVRSVTRSKALGRPISDVVEFTRIPGRNGSADVVLVNEIASGPSKRRTWFATVNDDVINGAYDVVECVGEDPILTMIMEAFTSGDTYIDYNGYRHQVQKGRINVSHAPRINVR